jgi:hypothetical protein
MAFRRFRRYAVLVLSLFAVVLMTEQVEHHDIACHLKTPQHCSACASSPLGADPHAPAALNRVVLTDAGGAIASTHTLTGAVLPAESSGRSPPPA